MAPLFLIYLCICVVCACVSGVSMSACVSVCVCVSVSVRMCVQARSKCWMSSSITAHLIFRDTLPWWTWSSLASLHRLVSSPRHLSVCLRFWNLKITIALISMWVLGICASMEARYWLSHFPAPLLYFPSWSLLFNTAAVSYWAGQCPKQQKLIFSLSTPTLNWGHYCLERLDSIVFQTSSFFHDVFTMCILTSDCDPIRPRSHVRKAIRPCHNHGGWYLPSLYYRLNSEPRLLFPLSHESSPNPMKLKVFL